MSIQKKWRGLNRLAEGALTCLTTAVFASKRSVYERAFPFSLTKALLVSSFLSILSYFTDESKIGF